MALSWRPVVTRKGPPQSLDGRISLRVFHPDLHYGAGTGLGRPGGTPAWAKSGPSAEDRIKVFTQTSPSTRRLL